jgi:hypothetical protein
MCNKEHFLKCSFCGSVVETEQTEDDINAFWAKCPYCHDEMERLLAVEKNFIELSKNISTILS